MKIKTIGLACALSSAMLAGCRQTPPQEIKISEYAVNTAVKAVKNDTVYFFLHKKIYYHRKYNGIEVIDTIAGYLKAVGDDMSIFIQNGHNKPKNAKQIGIKQKNGTFNYIL